MHHSLTMLRYAVFFIWCLSMQVEATGRSPRIIIVGAGASGIAAASSLLQRGFDNITILEAENRIGGRVYTREFGGYQVDVGGQWVHCEKANPAYDLAWPLGLLEHGRPNPSFKIYGSSGPAIPEEVGNDLITLYMNVSESGFPQAFANESSGDYFTLKFNEFFETHPDITTEQRGSIINMFNLLDMALNAADTWYNISASDGSICEGDPIINWKDKGYSTILDILMKKVPDPAEELPVLNNTLLNTEVTQINYNEPGGLVRVVTAAGDEYSADHVIVTTSIGVLKADYKTMFQPQLAEAKINAIKGLQLGSVAKLYLLYDEPWWTEENTTFNSYFQLYWTEKDRNEIANDPEKSWMLGLSYVSGVEYKPRLLLCWVTGSRARQMESIPEDQIFRDIKEIFHRFFGKYHNLTEPTAMLRSQWFTNKHFRGTWSYRSPEFQRSGSKVTDLSDPIMENGKPMVLFAGEITHPTHWGTVHGAMGSGWREADRLKKFYSVEDSTTIK